MPLPTDLPDAADPAWTLLTIAAVERETGIGKDTLRAWERRYGFPTPVRNERGDRAYTWAQVERLRRVNRLIAAGHRPGALMRMSLEDLDTLSGTVAAGGHRAARGPAAPGHAAPVASAPLLPLADALVLMRGGGGSPALRRWLVQSLGQLGLDAFVRQGVAPLLVDLGDGWLGGRLQVFEEHLLSEAIQSVLRHALLPLQAAAAPGRPRVLLTTVPGEEHGLGLLMAECVLTLGGAACAALGTATPLAEVATAARVLSADIVALGFSERMPAARRVAAVTDLRRRLDPAVALWLGGRGAAAIGSQAAGGAAGDRGTGAGWEVVDLAGILPALAAWRAGAGQAADAPVRATAA